MIVNYSDNLSANRYFDETFKTKAIKILPGEYYATNNNMMIVTVLGSCISVCLRDPVTRIAGMNHFLLPANNDELNFNSHCARYGVYAMEILINHLMKLGAMRHRLEAKVFGGGNVLHSLKTNSVGKQNVTFVLEYLKTEQIHIVAKDLLGDYPRKLYFFPLTGEVKLRKLRSLQTPTIINRESAYRLKVNQTPIAGGVDLFE